MKWLNDSVSWLKKTMMLYFYCDNLDDDEPKEAKQDLLECPCIIKVIGFGLLSTIILIGLYFTSAYYEIHIENRWDDRYFNIFFVVKIMPLAMLLLIMLGRDFGAIIKNESYF